VFSIKFTILYYTCLLFELARVFSILKGLTEDLFGYSADLLPVAENNMSKAGTQQRNRLFLQRMEQERVAKLCNRTIDLRAKVSGQCFPLKLDDRTHYLDDRSLLWFKELLAESAGEYTIRVYEQLMLRLDQARKVETLASMASDANTVGRAGKSITEVIPLDRIIARKEDRVMVATAVKLQIGELTFKATTLNVSVNAIKVVAKRLSCVSEGDVAIIDFESLYAEHQHEFLLEVPYHVEHVVQNESATHLVLKRIQSEDELYTDWMHGWLQQVANHGSKVNLDDRLYTYTVERYQRLFSLNLGYPVFWFRDNSIDIIHSSAGSALALKLGGDERDSEFSPLENFSEYLLGHNKSVMMLVYMWTDGDKTFTFCNADCPGVSINTIVAWLKQRSEWRIVLLVSKKIKPLDSEQIAALQEQGHELDVVESDTLIQQSTNFQKIGFTVDVSSIFQHSPVVPDNEFVAPEIHRDANQVNISAHPFNFVIKRTEARYKIKTSLLIEFRSGDEYEIDSIDVSREGLQLNVPLNCRARIDERVRITYRRWNQLVEDVSLEGLPYRVVRIDHQVGHTNLGLMLIKGAVDRSVNQFFYKTIEQQAKKIAVCDADKKDCFNSFVYSGILGNNIFGLPFFLGRDKNGERIVPAVLSGKSNRGIFSKFSGPQGSYDGTILQELAARLGVVLLDGNNEIGGSLRFGIYCYQKRSNIGYQWVSQTDRDMKTSKEKSVFVTQAMRSEKYLFFHCTLAAIKPLHEDTHLASESSQFRSNVPHKVKALQKNFSGLFAVGELIDVTKIVESLYRNKQQ